MLLYRAGFAAVLALMFLVTACAQSLQIVPENRREVKMSIPSCV
jgi:hypothetical protein